MPNTYDLKPTNNDSSLARDAGDDAAVDIPPAAAGISVYDLHTKRQRYVMLFATSFVSIIVPFSDTVYLPALKAIQDDLNTSQELVAASVSIYMFTAGLASLVWGPASDRFGRRVTYFASSVAFIGATFGCIFSPTIGVLIALRALQGAAVAGYLANGSAVIADIFPPSQRGTAQGLFMVSLLIGPVIGPVAGGGLSDAFGWRSTMISLAAFGGLVTAVIAALVPETHQYIVLKRLQSSNSQRAAEIMEKDAIEQEPPVFSAPWVPLRYLIEPSIAPHSTTTFISFGINLAALTEIPAALAAPPYSLSPALIGVLFLSDGIAGLIGSPLGGWVADKSAAVHPEEPESRLWYNTLGTLLVMPVGILLYAWSIEYKTHLVAIVVSLFLMGWAFAVCIPGMFGYLTTLKQSAAGAASAAVQTSMFVSAAVLILVSSVAVKAIGAGAWFSAMAGVEVIVSSIALWQIARKQRQARSATTALPTGKMVTIAVSRTHRGIT